MTDPRKDGDTPITDAARQAYADWKAGLINAVPEQPDGWNFARQLERQKAAYRSLLNRAEKQIMKWAKFHGEYGGLPQLVNALPPAGDIELLDDIVALAESEVGHDQAG